jgi:polar amino acid transport system permease protein
MRLSGTTSPRRVDRLPVLSQLLRPSVCIVVALVGLIGFELANPKYDWGVITRNASYFLIALRSTWELAFIAFGFSFALGLIFALGRASRVSYIRVIAVTCIEGFRAVPQIMAIFWFYFLVPIVTGMSTSPRLAALFALTFCNAAYFAEIIRAGIRSVPSGQWQAAESSGISFMQTAWRIILPQALRNMIGPLANQFVSLFKSTSLVYIVGVVEFFRAATIVDSREFRSFEIFSFVAIVYLCCCWPMSLISSIIDRRLRNPPYRNTGQLRQPSTS